MNCLLCWARYIEENILRDHYISHHRINPRNFFFNALLEKFEEIFFIRKYYRCDNLITSRSEEIQHNFLNHYQKGFAVPVEDRPKQRKKNEGSITKFENEFEFEKRKNTYNFENTIELIEDFFAVENINLTKNEEKAFLLLDSDNVSVKGISLIIKTT